MLSVRDLTVAFGGAGGQREYPAVQEVSFDLASGRCLGVLGESGSGKSVTAKALLGLLDPAARVLGGTAMLDTGEAASPDAGIDLLSMNESVRRRTVGSRIAMVYQDALGALNPVHPVGRQIGEVFRVHRGYGRRRARAAAIDMMQRVRIPAAESRAGDYPHQFSGGMRQRIVIAMALALDPAVLVADEPTTALDVTVQAQILDLLARARHERHMGLILITHDVGVVREVADDVAVMYAGRIVEIGPRDQVLGRPRHPYTAGLLDSLAAGVPRRSRLPAIPGVPPDPAHRPPGCSFAPRCPLVRDVCRVERPVLVERSPGRLSACHAAEEMNP